MKYLITFERYVKNTDNMASKLSKLFPSAKISKEGRNRIIIESTSLSLSKLRNLDYAGKIIPLKKDFTSFLSTSELIRGVVDSCKEISGNSFLLKGNFFGDIPFSKHFLFKRLGSTLSKKLDIRYEKTNPGYIIFIEIIKEKGELKYRVGISKKEFFNKDKSRISSEKFKRFNVVLESPKTVHEVADFLRVCSFFSMSLNLLGNELENKKLVSKATKIIKNISWSGLDIKYISSINEMKNKGPLIGFSLWAPDNEKILEKKLLNHKNIIFVIGNEETGLSTETRDKLDFTIHLGPDFPEPLRGSQALSYVAGFYARKIN